MLIEQSSSPIQEAGASSDKNQQGFSFVQGHEGEDSCILVSISKPERERMGIPLQRTLIIKLLGKTVGFNFLVKKVTELWTCKGTFEIVDLPNDYYLVKFNNEDDFNFVLSEGPWIILDHYLTVRKWFSAFNPESNCIKSVAVWLRFPHLPFDCFDNRFLTCFGNNIAKTIKIDSTTTKQSRGKFARVCVEIDLSKPLTSKYILDGQKYFIE